MRSAASTSSSPTPGSRRARRSRRRRWPSGSATTRSSAPATSSSRARRSACCAAGPRRLDRLRRVQERARRRQERGGVLVGEGRRAAPGPLPRRGGRRRRDPRQHRQPGRGAAGLADLGLVAGARSAPRPTGSSPTSSRSTTASARRWGSTSCPRTSPRRCCTSPRPARSGKSTGNVLNVDGGVPAAYPRNSCNVTRGTTAAVVHPKMNR